jgi:mitogen-activated protein kinase organizer 1
MPDHLVRTLDGHSSAVHAVRLTHDGAYCMTVSDDRSLKLWNPHKAAANTTTASIPSSSSSSSGHAGNQTEQALCVHTFGGVHGYGVYDVAISRDKSRFVSAGEDKAFFLWDVVSSRVIRRVQSHDQRTNAILFNDPESSVVFTASYDKTVKCWDLRAQSRDPIQILRDATDSVTSLVMGIEGKCLITGSVDGHIRSYDLRKGCLHTDNVHEPITSVSLSEDERTYLATCLTGKVKLIDCEDGKLLKCYEGHRHDSYKMEAKFCYTIRDKGESDKKRLKRNDGEHRDCRHQIIGSSEDGSIFHWDLLTGQVVDTSSRVHRRAISSIACHPTKDLFFTASYDSTVKCWSSTTSSS